MSRSSSSASSPSPKIRFAFTDHPLTVWAGAILLRLYFELMGLRAVLEHTLTPLAKRSNNHIPVYVVLLAWFYGLALGAERFAHFMRYRRDPLLPQLLGLPRFPSTDTPSLLSHLHLCPAHHSIGNVDAREPGADAAHRVGAYAQLGFHRLLWLRR